MIFKDLNKKHFNETVLATTCCGLRQKAKNKGRGAYEITK